jgi:hypothetical protein
MKMVGSLTGSMMLLLACGACSSDATPPEDDSYVACTEPRPRVCTREYRPVCGEREDGTRKTYSNACGACTDASVLRHRPGACESGA